MGIRLEQEQKKGLSKKMLPAVEILQMNAQELTDFIKELSLENPVVDVEEAVSLDKAKERMKKLEWLARLDEQNRTFYQYDRRDTKDDLENISGDDSENLAAALMLQLMGKGYSELEMGIFEYIANSLDPSGYYTEPLAEVFGFPGQSRGMPCCHEGIGACRRVRRIAAGMPGDTAPCHGGRAGSRIGDCRRIYGIAREEPASSYFQEDEGFPGTGENCG